MEQQKRLGYLSCKLASERKRELRSARGLVGLERAELQIESVTKRFRLNDFSADADGSASAMTHALDPSIQADKLSQAILFSFGEMAGTLVGIAT